MKPNYIDSVSWAVRSECPVSPAPQMIDTMTGPGALPFAVQLKALTDCEGRYQPKLSGLRLIETSQDNGLRMTTRLRELEVKDLLSLTRFFGFSTDAFSLAISLLDRFLSVMKVGKCACDEKGSVLDDDISHFFLKNLVIFSVPLPRFNQSTCPAWACAASTLPWSRLRTRRTCLWPVISYASVRIALQCLTWWGWRRSSWKSSTGRWRRPQPCASCASFTATSRGSSALRGKDLCVKLSDWARLKKSVPSYSAYFFFFF